MQTFEVLKQAPLPEGQAWVATRVLDAPAKEGMDRALLVRFTVDEKGITGVSGYDGCNFFFGTYTAQADLVNFSHMGATRRMCMPDPVLEAQTQALYEIMSKPVDMALEDGTLQWWQDGEVRIVWRVAKDPFFKPKTQEPAQ